MGTSEASSALRGRLRRRLAPGLTLLVATLGSGCAGTESQHDRPPVVIEGSVPADRPPVSARELRAARRSARVFARSYLAVAHGKADVSALRPLSERLARRPELVVPRRSLTGSAPAVEDLEVTPQAPRLVIAAATLRTADTNFRFTFSLTSRSGRWVVTTAGGD